MTNASKGKIGRQTTRRSLSLPSGLVRKVDQMAKSKRTSANQVLVGLIEKGLEARERERERFFQLTRELIEAKSESERERLREELAIITFGK
jgi:metal-responsive CopG/Arc/MetJ family transcriptional regulator